MRRNLREIIPFITVSMIISVFATCGLRAIDDASEHRLVTDIMQNLGWDDLVEHRIERLKATGSSASKLAEGAYYQWQAIFHPNMTPEKRNENMNKAKALYDEYLQEFPDSKAALTIREARASLDEASAETYIREAENLERTDPNNAHAIELRKQAVDILEQAVPAFKQRFDATFEVAKPSVEKVKAAYDAGQEPAAADMRALQKNLDPFGTALQAYCDRVLGLIESCYANDPRRVSYAKTMDDVTNQLETLTSFIPAFDMYMGLVSGRATAMLGAGELDKAIEIFETRVLGVEAIGDFEKRLQMLAFYYIVKIATEYKKYDKAIEYWRNAKYTVADKIETTPLGLKMMTIVAKAYFWRTSDVDKIDDYRTSFGLLMRVAENELPDGRGLKIEAQRILADLLLNTDGDIVLPTSAYFQAGEGMYAIAERTRFEALALKNEGKLEDAAKKEDWMRELYLQTIQCYMQAIKGVRRPGITLEERVKVEPKAWVKVGVCYYNMDMLYESAVACNICRSSFGMEKLANLVITRADRDFVRIAKLSEEEIGGLLGDKKQEAERVRAIIDEFKKDVERATGNLLGALNYRQKQTKKPWDVLLYSEISEGEESGSEGSGSRQYTSARTRRNLAKAYIGMAQESKTPDEKKQNFEMGAKFYQQAIKDFSSIVEPLWKPMGTFAAANVNQLLMSLYNDAQWDDVSCKVSDDGNSATRLQTPAARKAEAARRGELARKLFFDSISSAEAIVNNEMDQESRLRLRTTISQAKKQIAATYLATGQAIASVAGKTEEAKKEFTEGLKYSVAIQKEWDIATETPLDKMTTEIPNAWNDIFSSYYFLTKTNFDSMRANPTPETIAQLIKAADNLSIIAEVAINDLMDELRIAEKIDRGFLTAEMAAFDTDQFIIRRSQNLRLNRKAVLDCKDPMALPDSLNRYYDDPQEIEIARLDASEWLKNLDKKERAVIDEYYGDLSRFSDRNVSKNKTAIRVIASRMDALWSNVGNLVIETATKAGGNDAAKVSELQAEYGLQKIMKGAGLFSFYRVQNFDTPSTSHLLAAQSKCERGGLGDLELIVVRYILDKKDPDRDGKALEDKELQEVFYEMFAGRPRTDGEPIIQLANHLNRVERATLLEEARILHRIVADLMLDDMPHYVWNEKTGLLAEAADKNKDLADKNIKYDGRYRQNYAEAFKKIQEIREKFTVPKLMPGGKSVLETINVRRKGSPDPYIDIVEAEAKFRMDIDRIRDRKVELQLLNIIRTGDMSDINVGELIDVAADLNTQIVANPKNMRYQLQLIQVYTILGKQSVSALADALAASERVHEDALFPSPQLRWDEERGVKRRYPIDIAFDVIRASFGKPANPNDATKAQEWLKNPTDDNRKVVPLEVFRVSATPLNCLRLADQVCRQIGASLTSFGLAMYNEKDGNLRFSPRIGVLLEGQEDEIDLKTWTTRTRVRIILEMVRKEHGLDDAARTELIGTARDRMRQVIVDTGSDIAKIEKYWPHFKTPYSDGRIGDIDRLIEQMREVKMEGIDDLMKVEVAVIQINYRPRDRYEEMYDSIDMMRQGLDVPLVDSDDPPEGTYNKKAWRPYEQKKWRLLKQYSDLKKFILDNPAEFNVLTDAEKDEKVKLLETLKNQIIDEYDEIARKQRDQEVVAPQ
ncbi:MAG: hypothetical protein ABIH86_03645 [Planctomycetota bacterium]